MNEGSGTYLDKLLAAKRAELADSRGQRAAAMSDRELPELGARLPRPKDFQAALRGGPPAVIAEFKRASPSAGAIRDDADPRATSIAYQDAGAQAISVLTDRNFHGSFEDLRTIRQCVQLPLLCKDFILERWQIVEAKRTGADAILLIVAALAPPRLRQLIKFAEALEMQVLCEAHDAHELDRAMAAGARIIGVNARDLHTFELDLDRVIELRSQVPRSFTFVAESGVASIQDAARLRDAEVDALLVGTYLMRAEDPRATLAALIDAL